MISFGKGSEEGRAFTKEVVEATQKGHAMGKGGKGGWGSWGRGVPYNGTIKSDSKGGGSQFRIGEGGQEQQLTRDTFVPMSLRV